MKKSLFFLLIFTSIWACKSEYESIRTSNDPEAIYTKAKEYYEAEEYDKAQSLYEIVIPYFRGKERAESLFYNYAYTFYNTGEYILAAHYFKSFASTFYNSPKREEMLFMSAYSNYKMSPNFKLDQSYSQKAVEGFQSFANTYPNSDRIPEINKLIDEIRDKQEIKSFGQAKLYYDMKQYQAAVVSFDNLLKDFPGSRKTEEARFFKLKASYTLAENSVYGKKEERFEDTLKHYSDFTKKHPRSKKLNEAKEIYDNTIKELQKFSRT